MADNQTDSHDNQTFLMRAKLPELEEIAPEIDSYDKLWDLSLNKSDLFWGTLANKRLQWFQGFHQVCNHDKFNCEDYHLQWFIGGKLNVSGKHIFFLDILSCKMLSIIIFFCLSQVNCVDRHYVKNPNKTALIWEKDEPGTQEYVSYGELYAMMNRVANMLKAYGIRKGDCVAIYMPNSPLAVASMLACARIGALHSVIFAGFSAEALASRINDGKTQQLYMVLFFDKNSTFFQISPSQVSCCFDCKSRRKRRKSY
jgi:acetyl-CoA synthetase